jgi:hypothetical protein
MRLATGLLAGIVTLAGCRDERITSDTSSGTTDVTSWAASRVDDAPGAEVNQDLAALRRVTAKFHSFESAKAAGWSTQITGCMTDPKAGGMGFHYGNPKLIDGSVRADEPELLLYEREKNGRMRLVAVEYIVPLGAWSSPKPPRLFNRDFAVNQAFGIWALHAWVWKDNPSGIFADWNPRVSCVNAADASVMAHD